MKINPQGQIVSRWGLAADYSGLKNAASIMGTEFEPAFDAVCKFGEDSRRIGIFRIQGTKSQSGLAEFIITCAEEEQKLARNCERSEWTAETLSRLGRTLSLHYGLHSLCHAAVATIRDCLGLAGTALWVQTGDDLTLIASNGLSDGFLQFLANLKSPRAVTSAPALSARRQQPLFLNEVADTPLTDEIEGRFCLESPGGLYIAPLLIGTRLIGVLEMIARERDQRFSESRDLLAMVSEHVALAVNGALLFETAERMASADPLTGISNHRALIQYLGRRVSEVSRSGGELGVIMLDVDHFRRFNEEQGHDAGDEVLKRVARVLDELTRDSDLAARYGGEEFTVILPGSSPETTLRTAERIRTAIEAITFDSPLGVSRTITASLGCANWTDGDEPATLLKMADTALYRAKRAGRNRVKVFKGRTNKHLPTDSDNFWLAQAFHWLSPEHHDQSRSLLNAAAPWLKEFEHGVPLSAKQMDALRACLVLAPVWLSRWGDHDREDLRIAVESGELSQLGPILESVFERHDGQGLKRIEGKAIPIVGRVLNVLTSVLLERGSALKDDSGRFDPKIADLAARVLRAA